MQTLWLANSDMGASAAIRLINNIETGESTGQCIDECKRWLG
jgi:hypothetical protein